MSGPKTEVEYAQHVPREEAIRQVEQLLAALREGSLEVRGGDQSLTLQVAEQVKLVVEATRKTDRESLSLKFKWRRSGGGGPV